MLMVPNTVDRLKPAGLHALNGWILWRKAVQKKVDTKVHIVRFHLHQVLGRSDPRNRSEKVVS